MILITVVRRLKNLGAALEPQKTRRKIYFYWPLIVHICRRLSKSIRLKQHKNEWESHQNRPHHYQTNWVKPTKIKRWVIAEYFCILSSEVALTRSLASMRKGCRSFDTQTCRQLLNFFTKTSYRTLHKWCSQKAIKWAQQKLFNPHILQTLPPVTIICSDRYNSFFVVKASTNLVMSIYNWKRSPSITAIIILLIYNTIIFLVFFLNLICYKMFNRDKIYGRT